MPRIRCHYIDCVFMDDGYCGSAAVEIDPDVGCMTYSQADELSDEDWDEEAEDLEDWEIDLEDEDELWLDDDDI